MTKREAAREIPAEIPPLCPELQLMLRYKHDDRSTSALANRRNRNDTMQDSNECSALHKSVSTNPISTHGTLSKKEDECDKEAF